ncbi:MAG: substrate-binding domain-containing protein [Verrucomicrobiota bacterium]
MGLKVPEDISVIGGENMGITEFINPPITTVSEPLHEMADQAVEMMIALAEGHSPSPKTLTLPVELIERDSV